MADWENNEEIQIFREYLRIPTVHPNVNYGEFLFYGIFIIQVGELRNKMYF